MTSTSPVVSSMRTPGVLPTGVLHSPSVLHPLPWRPLLLPHPHPHPHHHPHTPKMTSPGIAPLISGQIPGNSPTLPSPRGHPGMVTPEKVVRDDLGKSLPIHCLVEPAGSPQHKSFGSGLPTPVDTFAIIPASCLFADIVPQALLKIGYTPSQALSAKGQLEVKNWKPLSLDSITDQPDVTVEQMLGDLTSVATLRIRLSNRCTASALEEIKAKLLDLLLQHSHGVLSSLGCPLDKGLLSQLRSGDYSQQVPVDTCQAFNKWYHDHSTRSIDNCRDPTDQRRSLPSSDIPSPGNRFPPTTETSAVTSPGSKLRVRTCFDAEFEIPLLQRWFAENHHPSKDQMMSYLDELNQLESRQLKKPLDLANIIYWFKNARAAQRRDSVPTKRENGWCQEPNSPRAQSDDPEVRVTESREDEADDASVDEESVPSSRKLEQVPELPNRNAVYVVQPLPPGHKEDDEFEVVHFNEESLSSSRGTLSPRYDSTSEKPPVKQQLPQPKIEGDENHNKCLPLSSQEEATDLSIRHRRMSGDSGLQSSHDSVSMQMNMSQNFSRGVKRDYDDDDNDGNDEDDDNDTDDHYLSSSNPSPRLHNDVGEKLSPAMGPPHLQHPHPHTYGHHALQMAAMSHALNMHYMHPASLYDLDPSSRVMGNSYKDDNSASAMDADRKKRSRVFIDPLSEIPKLEKWFLEDTHPSSYMIEKYTEELNIQTYRQRFPKLEPKNVQLWFKNHRAKVKRQRLEVTCQKEGVINMMP